jgi:hypothetical protein
MSTERYVFSVTWIDRFGRTRKFTGASTDSTPTTVLSMLKKQVPKGQVVRVISVIETKGSYLRRKYGKKRSF